MNSEQWNVKYPGKLNEEMKFECKTSQDRKGSEVAVQAATKPETNGVYSEVQVG